MALVAATAVFFESIKFLSGGFGNIVYFFIFVFVSDSLDRIQHAYIFYPTGIGIMRRSLWTAAKEAYPHFNGGFVIDIQANLEPVKYTFHWTGVDWTLELILQRLALIGIALVLLIMASAFFDQFEVSKTRRTRIWKFKKRTSTPVNNMTPALPAAAPLLLTPLKPSAKQFSFVNLLNAELKLLLNEPPWWWFAVAIVLVIACGISPPVLARSFLLPMAWVWPITLWSSMGNRDRKYNVQQLAFSSAFPVWRQLPAQWLAGFLIAFGLGFGVLLSLVLGGETTGWLAFFSAAIFIPSLALAAGVWSGSNKLFEVLYLFIWYFGPINHLLGLDFIGTQSSGRPAFFIPLSLLLIALALWGRKRQLSR
jgi:hypothetical protein